MSAVSVNAKFSRTLTYSGQTSPPRLLSGLREGGTSGLGAHTHGPERQGLKVPVSVA